MRRPALFYILGMQMRKSTLAIAIAGALYGAAIGIAADSPPAGKVANAQVKENLSTSAAIDAAKDAAGNANPAQVKDAAKDAPAKDAPEPGSPGDTLTREDARMAYLVYKLLDKKGKIKGANLKRGAKLFYQNCRPCHGEDGHRINFNPMGDPAFIGQRARDDMPTFWYQMNFGDEDRRMEAYYDEITLDEMKDIAGYAQTLP